MSLSNFDIKKIRRMVQKVSSSASAIANAIIDWSNISNKPTTFPPETHDHDDLYLNKENTDAFTPDSDYEPATKKYVDDNIMEINSLDEKTTLVDNDIFVIEDSADSFNKKKVKASNLPGSGGGGSLNIWMPDAPPYLPSAYDDNFDDETFDSSLWTEFDPDNKLDISEDKAGLLLTGATHVGDGIVGVFQTIPAGDFTIFTRCFQTPFLFLASRTLGFCLWEDAENTSKKLVTSYLGSNATDYRLAVARFTNYTTFETGIVSTISVTSNVRYNTPTYFKLVRNSSTYTWFLSVDGLHWGQIGSTSSLGFTPQHFGFHVNNINSGQELKARFMFFRYYPSSDLSLLTGRRV